MSQQSLICLSKACFIKGRGRLWTCLNTLALCTSVCAKQTRFLLQIKTPGLLKVKAGAIKSQLAERHCSILSHTSFWDWSLHCRHSAVLLMHLFLDFFLVFFCMIRPCGEVFPWIEPNFCSMPTCFIRCVAVLFLTWGWCRFSSHTRWRCNNLSSSS